MKFWADMHIAWLSTVGKKDKNTNIDALVLGCSGGVLFSFVGFWVPVIFTIRPKKHLLFFPGVNQQSSFGPEFLKSHLASSFRACKSLRPVLVVQSGTQIKIV